MYDCDDCIICNTNRGLFLLSKEKNAPNKNDQYVVYIELCLLSLSYKMITVFRKEEEGKGAGEPAITALLHGVRGRQSLTVLGMILWSVFYDRS